MVWGEGRGGGTIRAVFVCVMKNLESHGISTFRKPGPKMIAEILGKSNLCVKELKFYREMANSFIFHRSSGHFHYF